MPKTAGGPPAPGRPLRADARRNYERLLAAAQATFAEHGIDAPLDDIARRAGLGNATLYRHFPTRQALLEAVHRDRIEELLAQARQLLDAPAPDEALIAWLRAVAGHGSASRGLTATLTAALYGEGGSSWCHGEILAAATALLGRAQRAGTIRTEVTASHLLRLVHAITFAVEREPDAAEQARTLVGLLLDGLRSGPRPPAPPG
ncbi:TetR/AcrR family transcriptional regulator [Streptomyces hoynatensis]|uniref:TetR/AcrR family transcriptional regulator n=1 Tax=Streptomyces hoynatensis TaxID=1141874 RepID=UPI001F4E27A8|nr:TetR/AcrR family transcriptional regulator [Streptomyces hoynatensis]